MTALTAFEIPIISVAERDSFNRCDLQRPVHVLPTIVFAQFTGTSLWFAGNAVADDLQRHLGLVGPGVGYLTSAVQLGFIVGTVVFAALAVADRYSPSRVFLVCSLAGALSNLLVVPLADSLAVLLALRFSTGFFLAGIYPVGMKIAASWYDEGLGRALGYLVGALVLGTATPHLLRGLGTSLPWETVIYGVSVLAAVGALVMAACVPDGPHLPRGTPFDPRALSTIFRSRSYRASAFGYFGHMWELYTMWAFVPYWLAAYAATRSIEWNVSLWAFAVIAAGGAGCVLGGLLSRRYGSARVASSHLFVSGLCCLCAPLAFHAPPVLFIGFLLAWGITVVGDSPQLSALNATHAPRAYVGSALTIANAIGFSLTIASIQLVDYLLPLLGPRFIFWLLLPGPVFGLLTLRHLVATRR